MSYLEFACELETPVFWTRHSSCHLSLKRLTSSTPVWRSPCGFDVVQKLRRVLAGGGGDQSPRPSHLSSNNEPDFTLHVLTWFHAARVSCFLRQVGRMKQVGDGTCSMPNGWQVVSWIRRNFHCGAWEDMGRFLLQHIDFHCWKISFGQVLMQGQLESFIRQQSICVLLFPQEPCAGPGCTMQLAGARFRAVRGALRRASCFLRL